MVKVPLQGAFGIRFRFKWCFWGPGAPALGNIRKYNGSGGASGVPEPEVGGQKHFLMEFQSFWWEIIKMIEWHPKTPFCGSGTPDAPPEPLHFIVFPRPGAPGPQKLHLKRKGVPKALFNGTFII